MGLIRFITYLIIIWLAIQVYKSLRNSSSRSGRKKTTREMQSFVACDSCGLHIPRSEAIEHDGRYYCSEAHRDGEQD